MEYTIDMDNGGNIVDSKGATKKDVRQFFDEMDLVRENKRKVESREARSSKRRKAIRIINGLTEEYGDIGKVPESNALLQQAREWLGVFDDDIQETNVINLRQRVARLARKHNLRQSDIYQLLGYHLDLSMQTVKDKTYNNRFTVIEVALVWDSLAELESTENLHILVRAYETRNAREKDIRERRERYKQNKQQQRGVQIRGNA